MVKFKARRGRVAAQIHGNTRLEIGWTIGAAVILVFITAVTFIKLPGIKDPAVVRHRRPGQPGRRQRAVRLDRPAAAAEGRRRSASSSTASSTCGATSTRRQGDKTVFAYEEMVVPVGMTVLLTITADDVVHSWWIPELGGKMDAIPGYTNKSWFKATKPGTFKGQCAELCGRNHANMTARVRAVPFDEYQAWFDREAADIKTARNEGARQREELLKSAARGCAAVRVGKTPQTPWRPPSPSPRPRPPASRSGGRRS